MVDTPMCVFFQYGFMFLFAQSLTHVVIALLGFVRTLSYEMLCPHLMFMHVVDSFLNNEHVCVSAC